MRVTINSKYPYYVARPPTPEQREKAEKDAKEGKAAVAALKPPWRVVPHQDGALVISDVQEAKEFLSSPGVQSRLASGMLKVSDLPLSTKEIDFEKLAKGSVRKRASQPKPDAKRLAKSLGVTMRAAGESASQ